MESKNILFLTWKDLKHPNRGGAEKVIYEYAKNLVKLGHNVTWLASGFDGAKNEEIVDGIKIIRIYSIKTIYFLAWKWYKDYIKENKVDIIIDEAGGWPLFSPFYAKDKKIFFMAHHIGDKEWDFAFIKPVALLGKFIMKKIFQVYKNYPTITVSDSTKQELVNDLGFKSENIKVIENALDLKPIDKIDFSKKKNSILFLGRLMPMKRVEDAIKAFKEFIPHPTPLPGGENGQEQSYELNIVGVAQDKKYTEKLKELVKELGLENKVNFVGYNKEIFEKYLEESKIMLVPSYKEGFGLIVLEGNAYGLPVIGYDVLGLRDSIKDGKNGFKVADGDYKAMGRKLGEILENDKEYRKLAEGSLKYVKGLDNWEEKVKELEKFILK